MRCALAAPWQKLEISEYILYHKFDGRLQFKILEITIGKDRKSFGTGLDVTKWLFV